MLVASLVLAMVQADEVLVHKFDLNDELKSLKFLSDQICMISGMKNHHISINGGQTFDPLDHTICGTESCIKSYDVSPLEPKTISFQTKNGMFLCENVEKVSANGNCGQLTIPAHKDAEVIHFEFHPSDRARALMLVNVKHLGEDVKSDDDDDEHRLYTTSNLMKDDPKDVRWEFIMSHTIKATWGNLRGRKFNSDMIYGIRVVHHKTLLPTSQVKAFYSLNLGDRYRNPKDLVLHVESFMRKDKFLFVATADSKSNVRLHVSDDNAYTFREAEFSPDKRQVTYTILDASEGSVFINVFHNNNEKNGITWGNVYQSDSTGSRFSLSLDHNKRAGTHASFHKVESLEGVYIATMVANYDDPFCKDCASYDSCLQECKYVSRITFNKGGEWHPIVAPDCSQADIDGNACHLHLHGFASFAHTPLYSRKNAIGMIIATGNVGKQLESDITETMTYISRDGGLSWTELSAGSLLYASSHHGGLILSANVATPVQDIQYTFTESPPFLSIPLNGTFKVQQIIHNDKNELSKKFIVVTEEVHHHADRHSIIMQVDFSPLHERECVPMDKENTDYEFFRPHSYESKCLLGRKIEYVRKKQMASCFNPIGYEKPHKRENCQCDYADFLCDFGFTKRPKLGLSLDAFECVPIGKAAPDTKPPYPCDGVYNETKGYARVAGDSCVDGLSVQLDPILRSCPGGIGLLGSAVLLMFFALLLSFAGVLVYKSNPAIQGWFKQALSGKFAGLGGGRPTNMGYDPVQTHDQFSSDEHSDFDESVFANQAVETVSPSSTRHIPHSTAPVSSQKHENIFPDVDSATSDDPLAPTHLGDGHSQEVDDNDQSNIVHLRAAGQS